MLIESFYLVIVNDTVQYLQLVKQKICLSIPKTCHTQTHKLTMHAAMNAVYCFDCHVPHSLIFACCLSLVASRSLLNATKYIRKLAHTTPHVASFAHQNVAGNYIN